MMKKLYKYIPLLFWLAMFFSQMGAAAISLSAQQDTIPFSPYFKIPPKPEIQTSVYDYGKVLSETEKSSLKKNC
ncbi:hypothetical protein [Flavobacterium album]|uniref:hypothetical protein n=1 Tax=Flavobacterium album TaxID=2175091 RepID=UPI001FE50FF4|nr:hypothetical protein [Flavobacterium album]